MFSIIATTYQRKAHLERCLAALKRQRLPVAVEVIVADDGSTDGTREAVEALRRSYPLPLRHVWQEHQGFRAARIRNLAVREARGEALIFLDGDCVPFDDFVASHAAHLRPGLFLVGARYHLTAAATARLSREEVEGRGMEPLVPRAERSRLWRQAWRDRAYALTGIKDRPKVVTANLALRREDFERINGFDERFIGWGHEDEDLARRLVAAGVEKRSVVLKARVAHLWHEDDPTFRGKVARGDNASYFHRGFFLTRCRLGLKHRPMEDIIAGVTGFPWLAAAFPRGREGPPFEMEVLPAGRGRFDGRTEVRVEIAGAGRRSSGRAQLELRLPAADVASREVVPEILAQLEERL